jgi:hypothetical protein
LQGDQFDNGEMARTKFNVIFDFEGSNGFLAIKHFSYVFDDGRTVAVKFGRCGIIEEEGRALIKFINKITKRTGRFAGIKGLLPVPEKL